MIRLGSASGYPFDGPRLLAGWAPPTTAAVFAVLYKPDEERKPERYAVIYVGHAGNLAAARLPLQHPRSACWVKRAGSRWKLHIATYEVAGGTEAHREMITNELVAMYHPHCNERQYDNEWRDEWIGNNVGSDRD